MELLSDLQNLDFSKQFWKKEQREDLCDFKTNKATVIPQWSNDVYRHMDHWDRLENSEIELYTYNQMIFEKDILVGKGESLQQMILEQSICKTKICILRVKLKWLVFERKCLK